MEAQTLQRHICQSISKIGEIKGGHGTLLRYHVKMADGSEGQAWCKSEESVKHYLIGEPRIYRVEPLTRKGQSDTLKFAPANSKEIIEYTEKYGDIPLREAKAEEVRKEEVREQQASPIVAPTNDHVLRAAALAASVELVVAGQIEAKHIEKSMKKFHAMLLAL